MVPLQHPWGRAPSLGPCLWQRSAAGCPKTPILGPTRPLSPKVSLKNEFSLGTHQAGRVPTWSLYNTHGVAPLRLAPFLGYTGVIPMLIRSHNTPPPNTCTHSLPKKRVFPGYPPTLQGTHMVPLQHPWGRAPSLGPCLWQRSAAGCPKTPILGPTRPLSPKVSLKNEFSLGTHQAGRVPTWSLYNTHGVAPLRLAPFLGYTGVIPMLIRSHNTPPPPPNTCTHSLPKKRVFPGYPPTLQGTHMVPLQHPWGRAPSLGPCLWQRSAAGCPKTPILGPTRPLSPKVSLKNEFSLGTHQAGRVPTWSLYNTHGVAPLRLAPFLGYTGVIPMLIRSHNTPPPPPQHLYPQSP